MTKPIEHHLTDEILMGYAAGTLPEAFSILAAAHISMCDACRAQLASFETLGGAVLEDAATAEVNLDEGSLAATMARIAASTPQDKDERPRNPAFGAASRTVPAPLQDYIGADLSAVKWRPIGMGVKQAILSTSREASARLLFIPAGMAMPDHGHSGTEMTMVLQGAFQDEDGYFARGDVETADADVNHTPVADIHEDCICLAVTDSPLVFSGLLPRLMQKFIRI